MTIFPRRARRQDRTDSEVAAALQASLQAHARRVPRADYLTDQLAERILAAVDEPEPGPAPRRGARARGWALPAIAAASVAAVAAIAVGLTNLGDSGPRPAPPQQGAASFAPGHGSSGVTRPAPSHAVRAVSSAPLSTSAVAPAAGGVRLHDVRVVDLTFAGTDDGWALASADCLNGTPGRCTALLRTHDGRHWRPMPGAAFNVPGVQNCADPCVEHLRFATDQVGYAFGPSAFFMTSDGGRSWQQQPGGALALETADHNVVRVTSPHTGCPGWCDVTVETAAVGSTSWTRETLPSRVDSVGVAFDRGGPDVYLLALQNPAGGSDNARSTLYRSTDDGATWQQFAEPCPSARGEVDSVAIGAGADGRVSVLCARRGTNARFAATSSDAGASFTARGSVPSNAAGLIVGDPATVLAAAGVAADGGRGVVVSHDGGATWRPVAQLRGGVDFIGFESPTVGRVVADGGRVIWTTRDAGRTWQPVRLP